MRVVRRWKRRIRTAKKKTSGFFSFWMEDPTSNRQQSKNRTKQKGWTSERLKKLGNYPTPQYVKDEAGNTVYGPVRTEKGWAWYNANGTVAYSKQDKIKQISKDNRPVKQKVRASSKQSVTRQCGKSTADGTPCQRRGACPHHKKGLK